MRVWEALLPIPPGALVAYKDVAEHLGKPKASRAVANKVTGSVPVSSTRRLNRGEPIT